MYGIIPLAGFGTRFAGRGWDVPKPLIEVLGKPMLYYSVASLPLLNFTETIFVMRDDEFADQLQERIEHLFGGIKWSVIRLPFATSGQAETVYLATEKIPRNAPIVIHNGDTAFNAHFDKDFFKGNNLLLFKDSDPRWSFARLDGNRNVVETAEKIAISDFASTGTYSFESAGLYREIYREGLDRVSSERYIAPMFNRLISMGLKVGSEVANQVFCMGTPEDLNETLVHLKKWERNSQILQLP